MFSKKTVTTAAMIVLIAVCVIGIAVTGTRGYTSYGFRNTVLFVSPFQEAASRSVAFAKDIWNHYFFLVSAAKTNDYLRKSLSRNLQRDIRCNEIELSNTRLRKLLSFRETISESTLAAEVISKDPCPWFKSVIINKGGADQVEIGMAAVVPEGIAGVVTDVSFRYSKVLLIIDQNSAVDALAQKTRARGIVKGNSDHCLFKYVLRKHDIAEGDTVISSGLDGVFPKGLRVGKVSNVTKSNSGVFQEVKITPFADFETLEEVLIILESPRTYSQFVSEQ
jgi:rod shape-determining protein MreC